MDTETIDNLIIQAIKNIRRRKKNLILNQNNPVLKYIENN